MPEQALGWFPLSLGLVVEDNLSELLHVNYVLVVLISPFFLVKYFHSGLDMSPYLLGEAANQITPNSPPLYDLHAVVYHYGNSYIGHYTNTAKAPSSEGLGENYSE